MATHAAADACLPASASSGKKARATRFDFETCCFDPCLARWAGVAEMLTDPGVPVAYVDERGAAIPTMTALAWLRPLLNLLGDATALKCLRRAYRASRVG
jgi:hypothetical protein